MANSFKSYGSKAVGTAAVSVLNGAPSTQIAMIGLSLANVSSTLVYVDVYVTKGGINIYLAKGVPLPVANTLIVVGGDQKINIMPTDVVKVVSSLASSVDVFVSTLEIA